MRNLSLSIVLLCTLAFFFSCNKSGKATSTQDTSSQPESSTVQQQTTEDQTPAAESPQDTKTAETAVAKESPETSEAFDYLEKITIHESEYETIFVKYNEATTQVYNKKRGDLPTDDPFHISDDAFSMRDIKALKTKITPSGPDYYVVFSWGGSADPTYYFYKEGSYESPEFYVMSHELYIPGNGNIYSAGHTNSTFNKRRKYTLTNGKFVEADQPFYYVGLKTQTLKPVKLYKSKNMSQVIANLPANYSIEVLINNPENSSMFLVKTDFGLTGWLEIPGENMFRGNEMIEGIFMAGD